MNTKENKNINELIKGNGVGKKFLIISISLTIILNGSVALWFIWYIKKYGIDKFIS
tara:strand:- start:493 stop:660 length:168 start_codon:yes stop_codon:yes gene_type:complete